jgi:putative MATE family efflux protein
MPNMIELEEKPVGKLLFAYSVPSVIAMIVNSIYNVVDRIFVSQYTGEAAFAGITIDFPLMLILFALSNLVGIGGASLFSIAQGKHDRKEANRIFGNTMLFGLLIGFIVMAIGLGYTETLMRISGATAEVMEPASAYFRIIVTGYLLQNFSYILNCLVRTENRPVLSMTAMIASAAINIVLDFVFIALLGWGVAGAAYATLCGQGGGLLLLISHYLGGKTEVSLTRRDLRFDWKKIGAIAGIGFSAFIATLGASVSTLLLNKGLVTYGGIPAVVAMGAVNSLFTFFIMPVDGLTQGMQPIIGYNHGAERPDRVGKTLRMGLTVGIGFSTTVFLLYEFFPATFLSLFIDPDSPTMETAITGLRIFVAMLPLLCVNIIGIGYFQAIARGRTAFFLGILRSFVFLVPLILVLPRFLGLLGVWLVTPISDGLGILVVIVVLARHTVNNRKNRR